MDVGVVDGSVMYDGVMIATDDDELAARGESRYQFGRCLLILLWCVGRHANG
jgi:hypothetical protein